MKRDWDTVRSILLHIEADTAPMDDPGNTIAVKDIAYHLEILQEAGLIYGFNVMHTRDGGEPTIAAATYSRLTWEGHDLLDAIRNDTVWNKTKAQATKSGGAMTLGVLTQLATHFLMEQLGMKP